jgi:hypothetical protein
MEGAGNYTCLVETPLGSTPVLTRLLTVLHPSSVKLNYSGGQQISFKKFRFSVNNIGVYLTICMNLSLHRFFKAHF